MSLLSVSSWSRAVTLVLVCLASTFFTAMSQFYIYCIHSSSPPAALYTKPPFTCSLSQTHTHPYTRVSGTDGKVWLSVFEQEKGITPPAFWHLLDLLYLLSHCQPCRQLLHPALAFCFMLSFPIQTSLFVTCWKSPVGPLPHLLVHTDVYVKFESI